MAAKKTGQEADRKKRTMFIAVERFEKADPSQFEDPAVEADLAAVVADNAGVSGHAVTVEEGVATTATAYESRLTAEAAGRAVPTRLKRAEFAVRDIQVNTKDKDKDQELS
jgi:hypothetical protein